MDLPGETLAGNSSGIIAVVLTYAQRGHHLERVLDALCHARVRPESILVVDNGSTSNADRQKSYSVPVTWMCLEANLGSAGGYRAGILEAWKKNLDVWLLDDDNLPSIDCLERLIYASRILGENAIVVTHRPERPEFQEIIKRGGSRPIRRNSFMAFHWLGTPHGNHFKMAPLNDYLPLAYFGYGGALIPKKTKVSNILPETELFVYHDDSDWSQRLVNAGFSAWLVPGAHITDIEVSWGGAVTGKTSPLFSHKVASDRPWYAVRNRAWVERRMGFGGPGWHINAWLWILLQGFRAILRDRKIWTTFQRMHLVLCAFRSGASGRLDPYFKSK